MTPRPLTHEGVDIGVRLLDEAFLAWSFACSQCTHALRAWFEAPRRDRAGASWAYRAALDREEAAARDLERLTALSWSCD
jgi:hypothetical protein